MSNSVSPNVYKILGESAALLASTFAMSKTPLISWLNTPTTPGGLALCTGVNACASAAADVANQVYNQEGDASYRIAFQVVGLLSSFALLTAFAKPIAARTGMSLNPSALATLTAFHGIVKAVIYAGYTFAQSLTSLKTIVNIDDMKQIPDTELGIRKKQFEEKQTDTWDSYTLNMQAQFNFKLKANGQALLPFTSHKTDEALTKEELEAYCESIGEKPTVEQAKVMIAHDVPPPKGCDVLPGLAPESVVVGKLSDTELRWYHSALCQKPEGLNAAQYKAFAEAFYKLDLTPPSQHFVVDTVPTSADGVTKTQANYHLYYFLTHRDAFNDLDPKQQMVLNAIFEKAGSSHWDLTAPKKDNLKDQSKEVLQHLSFQYDVQPNLWNILPTDYQQAFNEALENHGLPVRELTTQPWSTTKKVAVYVGVPLLIVGAVFGLTWAGLAFRASRLDSETCIGDESCETFEGPMTAEQYTAAHGELPQAEETHQMGEQNHTAFVNTTTTDPHIDETPQQEETHTIVLDTPEYYDSGDQSILFERVQTFAAPLFNSSSTAEQAAPVITLSTTHDVQPPKDASLETEEPLPTLDEATIQRLMYGDPILRDVHNKFLAEQEEAMRSQQSLVSEETVDLPMDRTSPLSERTIVPEDLDCDPYVPTELTQQFTNASLAPMCKDGFIDMDFGCFPKDFQSSQAPVIHTDSSVKQPPVADHFEVEAPLDFSLQTPCAHEFERTEPGCSSLKVGNESLVALNPVTLLPENGAPELSFEAETPLFERHQTITSTNTLPDHVFADAVPTEAQATNGTVYDRLSGTIDSVSSFWNETVYPSIRSGVSKYIWNLDGAEVRANYNAEIAQGYQDLPCGKAAFDALKEGTPISKECVEAAVAFRDEVKTKYQDDSAYLEWAVIQNRQLYEYHFQDAWNKGDYQGALNALWAGLGQFWETGSANPTIANLEAMGKSPESIACGAFATNKDINKQLGVNVPQVDCRDALPKQARATDWTAPLVYFGAQAAITVITTIPTAYVGYKVIQKVVWPILSTLGSLLLCCRRRKKDSAPAKEPVATIDETLWKESSYKLSAKSYAPKAFDKVASVTVGDEKIENAQFNNLPGKVNSYIEITSGTWQAALKVVAFIAASELITSAVASWDDVEDQSITAKITKGGDDKVTIDVQAMIKGIQYKGQKTYLSPQAMRDASGVNV